MAPTARAENKATRTERILAALGQAQRLSSTLPSLEAFSSSTVTEVWDAYSQCEYAIGLLRLDLPEDPVPIVLRRRAKDPDPTASNRQVPLQLEAAIAALREGNKSKALALARRARDALRDLLLAGRKRLG